MESNRMKKSRKRRGLLAFLSILCVMLMALCIFLAVMCFDLRMNDSRKDVVIKDLRQTHAKQQDEISALQEKVDALQKVIDDQNAAAAEAEAKAGGEDVAGALHEGEGTIPKPQGEDSLLQSELQAAGLVLGEAPENADAYFTINEIVPGDGIFERINGKSYRENPNVALSDLRYLTVLHYNFDGLVQTGEIIVNAAIAEDTVGVFKDLFANHYQIYSMYLVDNYWTGDGDSSDTASIEVNNTSAFNYREITGGGKLSNHAYGRAIDINPQQNPYVTYSDGMPIYSHENAAPYIDRTSGDPHVIVEGDICYNIFTAHGFSWGGHWDNPVDYQHFEK